MIGAVATVRAMRAIEFNLKDPEFGAELVEITDPDLPGDAWVRVAVTAGGICGSDLHLFGNGELRAPALGGFWTFPFLLGHEIAGRVVEAGSGCDVPVGTRVAVDPAIPCAARGIDPVCRMCAAGHASCCLELVSGVLTPGMSIGFTVGLGGGWADQVLAHRSMLHVVPDAVPDSIASLHEPVSVAVHGLLRKLPCDGDQVLVVGSGIIGLAAVAAVRALFPACEVTATARHVYQAEAARAAGAHRVVTAGDRYADFDELAAITGGRVTGRGSGRMLLGGFPYVIEAVGGVESVTESSGWSTTGARCCSSARAGSGRSTSARSGSRRPSWWARGTTPTVCTRRGGRTTRSTSRSTCSPRRPARVGGDAHVRARSRSRRGRDRDRQAQLARDQGRVPSRRAGRVRRRQDWPRSRWPNARPLDELRERDVLEHAPALVVDADPDLLQDAVALAMVGVLRERELRTLDRGHDVGERDLLRRVREHVAAAHAALRTHQARALDREQDLLEVRLRERRALGDLLHRGGPVAAPECEREQRAGRAVAAGRDLHPPMLARLDRGGRAARLPAARARSSRPTLEAWIRCFLRSTARRSRESCLRSSAGSTTRGSRVPRSKPKRSCCSCSTASGGARCRITRPPCRASPR